METHCLGRFGPYSHAIIIVDRQVWFESNDDGVQYLLKRVAKVEKMGSDIRRLLDVSEFEKVCVLWHSVLDTIYRSDDIHRTKELQATSILQSICVPLVGLQYPALYWLHLCYSSFRV